MANYIHAKDLRAGHSIIFNNELYLVLDHSFNKTAMRGGIVKCKIKNYQTGAITVQEFTGEKLEQAMVEKLKVLFSYADDSSFVFINETTFETIEIPKKQLEWESHFLSDDLVANLTMYDGKILGISLPEYVSVEVIEAEEAVRGDTATSLQKKAWLASGLEVIVPQFIKSGDRITISTSDGKYKSR